MSIFSLKALEILRALDNKPEFYTSDLVSNGFSGTTAKLIVKELEENGYIFVSRTYINGNVAFELL